MTGHESQTDSREPRGDQELKRHEEMMRRCIELAGKAAGRTSPNPLVGSVVTDTTGSVVGEGWHERAGEPHAEVHALDRAGENAKGGTLYVNLEPCCHYGRTPPCSKRVIESGVKTVVVGMRDPNPKVDGGGLEELAKSGIDIISGVLEKECIHLNRAFIKRVAKGLPWVTLKLAATLDGRIADRYGTSQWITGPEARAYVQHLRNAYDVVLIGAGTAVKDDPRLNVRDIEGGRNPVRAVVDPNLRIYPDSLLCKKETGGQTLVFSKSAAIEEKSKLFSEHVKLIPTPVTRDLSQSCQPGPDLLNHRGAHGMLDMHSVLRYLVELGNNSVLCEGGGKLAASLIRLGLIDELIWFIAPKLLLDCESIDALSLSDSVRLDDAVDLSNLKVERLGADLLVHALIDH